MFQGSGGNRIQLWRDKGATRMGVRKEGDGRENRRGMKILKAIWRKAASTYGNVLPSKLPKHIRQEFRWSHSVRGTMVPQLDTVCH